jgi:hypothetical protein
MKCAKVPNFPGIKGVQAPGNCENYSAPSLPLPQRGWMKPGHAPDFSVNGGRNVKNLSRRQKKSRQRRDMQKK